MNNIKMQLLVINNYSLDTHSGYKLFNNNLFKRTLHYPFIIR